MIKAVIFDVDGVLVDSFESVVKFHSDLLIKFGYPAITQEEFLPQIGKTLKENIKTFTKSTSEEEIEKIFQAGLRREVPYDFSLMKIPEHLKETIEILSKKYILGIATSRTRNGVYEIPQLSEILKFFRTVIGFEDVEKHKPYPDLLLLTMDKLGIKPEELVYVGDLETDFQAAKLAGAKFILFSKEKISGVDVSTNIFSELPELISKL